MPENADRGENCEACRDEFATKRLNRLSGDDAKKADQQGLELQEERGPRAVQGNRGPAADD